MEKKRKVFGINSRKGDTSNSAVDYFLSLAQENPKLKQIGLSMMKDDILELTLGKQLLILLKQCQEGDCCWIAWFNVGELERRELDNACSDCPEWPKREALKISDVTRQEIEMSVLHTLGDQLEWKEIVIEDSTFRFLAHKEKSEEWGMAKIKAHKGSIRENRASYVLISEAEFMIVVTSEKRPNVG